VLFLVHHGDAVGPDVNPMRPLSDRGRVEVDMLAQNAAERGARPDVIWHSGKLRAKQTAEAYWKRCNPLAVFAATRGLQPTDPTNWIADAIAGDSRHIMLVGHFPHLPRLLGRLINAHPDAGPLDFPLNGTVALENVEGKWVERWRLNP
jgi:phosphohistidine phosphatase